MNILDKIEVKLQIIKLKLPYLSHNKKGCWNLLSL